MPEIVSKNPINDPKVKVVKSHSTFPMSAEMKTTARFGEYYPHMVLEGTVKDWISFISKHSVRSMNMSAPLMDDIKLKKDYFVVPLQCVLPRNWEKVYRNPKIGDDVNASVVSTTVLGFEFRVRSIVDSLLDLFLYDVATPESETTQLRDLMMLLFTAERFYSDGCLLSQFGCHLADVLKLSWSSGLWLSIDEFIDDFFGRLLPSKLVNFQCTIGNSSTITVHVWDRAEDSSDLTLREFLTRARDERFTIESLTFVSGVSSLSFETLSVSYFGANRVDDSAPVNLFRLFAYQLVCAHFFSNDNIDYIFSADLYRQNLQSILDLIAQDTFLTGQHAIDSTFLYNGISCLYDVCSSYYFNGICDACGNVVSAYALDPTSISGYQPEDIYDYLRLIFGHNRSLRFQDYFTGARSLPLAIGDTGVAVANNEVSAVNITRGIQMQRFLNFVNKVPSRIEDYLRNLFPGAHVQNDQHDPKWIAHTDDLIYASEIENTGQAQLSDANSTTAVLKSNSSQFAFETDLDRPCVILGIQYFDIPRSYYRGIERMLNHVDRFDMFNPFLQFIGDQDIQATELDSTMNYDKTKPFAYTLRHMEYKQLYSQASGGFAAGVLPGWAFLAGPRTFKLKALQPHISPEFVRSMPAEFDQFFPALTGWSLGTYFHFIVKNVNEFDAKRDMVYAPSIL